MNKLIIIRGNSGSGKSTIARELREAARNPKKVALVEQDYLRRIVLKEKETEGTKNIGLIEQTVTYALDKGYDVILEGILYSKRYQQMIRALTKKADQSYIFYLDVTLEETLIRHKTKPNAHEFGEEEMREWYKSKETIKRDLDFILPQSNSIQESVDKIQMLTSI
jgi:predicted ABC-type ATPase